MSETQLKKRATQGKRTALIAGGGVAGLAAAVFLDEMGFEVKLCEKLPVLGGRARSFRDRKTGMIIDKGQHMLMGAYHETIALLERLGVKHKLDIQVPTTVSIFNDQSRFNHFKLGNRSTPYAVFKALMGFGGFGLIDKCKLLKLSVEIKKIREQGTSHLSNMTVRQYLNFLGQSPAAQKNFWDVLTLATLNDLPDHTTADGLLGVLNKCATIESAVMSARLMADDVMSRF
ncbi:MAG: oleate hydratase [Deltaproteobacteria bacterium]|nr:oleate hydratase [Deltaproteobacteria bacterium]